MGFSCRCSREKNNPMRLGRFCQPKKNTCNWNNIWFEVDWSSWGLHCTTKIEDTSKLYTTITSISIYLSVLSINPIYLSINQSINQSVYLPFSVYLVLSISINLYLSFSICLFLSVFFYLCRSLSISAYLYLSLSISIYIYLALPISISTYSYLDLYLSRSISISIYIYFYLYLFIPTFLYLYRSLSLSIAMDVYLSIHRSSYLSICLSNLIECKCSI